MDQPTAVTPPAPRDRLTREDVLVDTEWLATHLTDPEVVVIEVDVSPAQFSAGHIAGSVLWNIYADLKDDNYRLVDGPTFERLVRRSGIAPDTTVVLYGYGPALGLWLLQLYGHRDVRLLDASRDTWRAEGRPWTSQPAARPATTYSLPTPNDDLRADRRRVEAAIADEAITLLDVRSLAEFTGERFWPSGGLEPGARAGHVPGAMHLEPEDSRDDRGAFLDRDRLATMYRSVDPDPTHEVLTYCTIGGRAANAWFVLTYLLDRPLVRVYDGSWAEWGRLADTPVDTGPPDGGH